MAENTHESITEHLKSAIDKDGGIFDYQKYEEVEYILHVKITLEFISGILEKFKELTKSDDVKKESLYMLKLNKDYAETYMLPHIHRGEKEMEIIEEMIKDFDTLFTLQLIRFNLMDIQNEFNKDRPSSSTDDEAKEKEEAE